ncbi:hypothetical protein MPSEU_000275300 [Mayamaea pseudoterrestris]|nr:hypothetical protein MPSEU_000275300 [Mayamaea pseudoterrestris]
MAAPLGGNDSKFYTIGLTGASGLVGTALQDELARSAPKIAGKPVRIVQLKRGPSAESKDIGDESTSTFSLAWNPMAESPNEVIDPSALAQMDAIVHLSGENVATGLGPLGFLGIRPWTPEKKQEILDSRLKTTEALVSAINAKSSPTTMLVASGIGVYGYDYNEGEKEAADETMDVSQTPGFLAEMARLWEQVTQPASKKNRVVNMRFGVVMSKNGGALGKLYPIFFLGGGGNVGSGRQYLSFISARDIARAIVHCLDTPSLKGPVNLCAPEPCTNAEFTKSLGKVISRPTLLPLPGFAVSALFGEMGEEMLLGGVRAKPTKLLQSGFQFRHPTIEQALKSAVEENI